ncbi:3-oxoacyl-ACP reductase FabG [Moraxella osloensis]|uniref:3-oxoacyl-[acyl-carrier-protein] reductase n=1 Tax=Faucicola osloensis TaxID=34062 RepID=A0A2D2LWG5_FAUOS|nr:3-oxoacyl-ACP reductase FabG [Moraxella osloensis]ATR79378.1 3-oxoacyl-ACP reductase [Moraxella osloensis]MCK6159070.1 3-oxoacyl-ACP reductase FabG [Moraxella osloensis]PKZ68912.1 3-oxoacyl-ACP reductase FabG [Moraxella osloensis]
MTQRIALVTGASRGIGQAIAKRLANEGYVVIGTATSEKGAAAVNDYLQELGGAGRVLNVQDTEQINQLFDSIEKEFGNVQVLVNNAGITQDGLLMRMDDNAWERVLDVNLTSVFRTSKRAIKGMMKARQGRIINITSVVAAMGNAGQTNYTASKAGIEGFTRSLAREIGSRQITVNCVAPGFIDTDMTKDLDEALIQSMLNAVPLARLGKPEDIAAAVNFLASEEAGYITGTVLDVNGGMYM